VQPLGRPCPFALAGLLAQAVNVDLGQRAQDRQGQFTPRRGKVEVLCDRDKGDVVLTQMIEGLEQSLKITVEAVNCVDDHDVADALLDRLEQLFQCSPVVLGTRDTRVYLDLDQFPPSRLTELFDGQTLGVQGVALCGLFAGRNPGVSNRSCLHLDLL
jgi:hypothetical protein